MDFLIFRIQIWISVLLKRALCIRGRAIRHHWEGNFQTDHLCILFIWVKKSINILKIAWSECYFAPGGEPFCGAAEPRTRYVAWNTSDICLRQAEAEAADMNSRENSEELV